MAAICMTKCVREVIRLLSLPFFKLDVNDGYCRQKVNEFHPRLNFTVGNEPSRFLDSKLHLNEERSFSVKVFH